MSFSITWDFDAKIRKKTENSKKKKKKRRYNNILHFSAQQTVFVKYYVTCYNYESYANNYAFYTRNVFLNEL